jgi:imidazolonepropionase-like amidohydrolase
VVRFNITYSADTIKTCASGGVPSPTDDVDVPQLSQQELNALVDEAHTLPRKTGAHTHGAQAAQRAIRAGIDSIEHSTLLDDRALRMMHDNVSGADAYDPHRMKRVEIPSADSGEGRQYRRRAGRDDEKGAGQR